MNIFQCLAIKGKLIYNTVENYMKHTLNSLIVLWCKAPGPKYCVCTKPIHWPILLKIWRRSFDSLQVFIQLEASNCLYPIVDWLVMNESWMNHLQPSSTDWCIVIYMISVKEERYDHFTTVRNVLSSNTVWPKSSDPFYIAIFLYKMGHYFWTYSNYYSFFK